ncbi:hypothetical protein AMECASPLE_039531 [Ameca splendens]|uniref:Uncharacterized protein n=1 Tax=Ameca splendens TaxID=208324 RepID=A0ABV0ZUK8_9TELE
MICLRLNPFLIDSEMSKSAILKSSFSSLKDQHPPLRYTTIKCNDTVMYIFDIVLTLKHLQIYILFINNDNYFQFRWLTGTVRQSMPQPRLWQRQKLGPWFSTRKGWLQVGGEFLPQVEEFKYLGVLFTVQTKRLNTPSHSKSFLYFHDYEYCSFTLKASK